MTLMVILALVIWTATALLAGLVLGLVVAVGGQITKNKRMADRSYRHGISLPKD